MFSRQFLILVTNAILFDHLDSVNYNYYLTPSPYSIYILDLSSCSDSELRRQLLSSSEFTYQFFRELGNELYRRCLKDDFYSAGAAAAVWAYCLSELLILNPSPPPELEALRSQKSFDPGTFDFMANLRKCLDKSASGRGSRGRSETAAVFWFRLLPAYSPMISSSKPTTPSLRPVQRSELLKVYSNRYCLLNLLKNA